MSTSRENIEIAVRVRPLMPQEATEEECVKVEPSKVMISNQHKLKQFKFQHVFDRNSSQQQIFQIFCQPLINELLKGYSSTLIAYGQNKSGKTHTLYGIDSQEGKGMILRMVDYLRHRLITEPKPSKTYIIRVSYVEIYNEEIIDLLSIRKGTTVEIVENTNKQMEMKNVQMKFINTIDNIQSYLLMGNRKKQLAYAKKYRNPEQSTTIFTIYIESLTKVQDQQDVRKSRLDIVDLSASDQINRYESNLFSGKKGKQYDLSHKAFQNVIYSLSYGDKNTIIPYNDSKITKLLRNCFGGNSKTKILLHLFPIVKFYDATINTLRIGQTASLIQNTPSCQVDIGEASIQRYMEQLREAKLKLQQIEETVMDSNSAQDNTNALKMSQVKHIAEGNQFVSEQLLINIQKESNQQKLKLIMIEKKKLKKRIQSLSSIFINVQLVKDDHQIKSKKEDNTVPQSQLIQTEYITQPFILPSQPQISNTQNEAITAKLSQRERSYKQEISDLQKSFQKDRENMTNTIRQLQKEYKFYSQVAQRTVRQYQIDLLRVNSKYDSTKRQYQIPLFTVRNKTISPSSRLYYSPSYHLSKVGSSKSIAQRKFTMGQISSSKLKSLYGSINKNKNQITEIKEINMNSHRGFDMDPYCQVQELQIKQKKKVFNSIRENQYELNKVVSKPVHRLISTNRQTTSPRGQKQIKALSPRFKFK